MWRFRRQVHRSPVLVVRVRFRVLPLGRLGAIGHEPQHARATVSVTPRRLENVVRQREYPLPCLFPSDGQPNNKGRTERRKKLAVVEQSEGKNAWGNDSSLRVPSILSAKTTTTKNDHAISIRACGKRPARHKRDS